MIEWLNDINLKNVERMQDAVQFQLEIKNMINEQYPHLFCQAEK